MTVNLRRGNHKSCGGPEHRVRLPANSPVAVVPENKPDRPAGPPKPRDVRWARSRHPVYRVWSQMIQRCYLKTARNYRWYGGRGIGVCDRWRFGEGGLSGFECFLSDMGERPDGMTVERERTAGDYGPGNCSWATWSEQANNRTNSRFVEYGGRTQTVTQWATELGRDAQDIGQRMTRGWTFAQAAGLEQRPVGPGRRPIRALREMLICGGLTLTLAEWADRADVSVSAQTIRKRLDRGWPPGRAIFGASQRSA